MRIARIILLLASGCLSLPAAAQVASDYYAEPGLHPQREQLTLDRIEHIDPFSGSLKLTHADIVIPGNGGLDLKVQRIYNSVQYEREFGGWQRTVTGVGWTMHFGRLLKSDPDLCTNSTGSLGDNPVFELPDGTQQILYNPAGLADPLRIGISTARWTATLVESAIPA